jgi:chitosanase
MTFSRTDKLKAMAIVRVFETGKPLGDYAACVVLDDGAGISYGINQFTHRSGSLLAVIEKYFAGGGAVGRDVIAERLPVLKRTTRAAIDKLSVDAQFKKTLKSAAITHEMREAQEEVAFEKYLKPALNECASLGLVTPLSLAVVYDSVVHGSWERIRDRTGQVKSEADWIARYVRARDQWLKSIPRLKKTSYRTAFFLAQIAHWNWKLEFPLNVHGVRLTNAVFDKNSPVEADITTAKSPPTDAGSTYLNDLPKSSDGRVDESTAPAKQAQPANYGEEEGSCLDEIEKRVNDVAAKVDQADRIVTTTATRTDRAKSLWTTVAGTFWQMVWAVGGFFAGVPREVWLVVAVIAGMLMLFYLYRQITLGRIREGNGIEKAR